MMALQTTYGLETVEVASPLGMTSRNLVPAEGSSILVGNVIAGDRFFEVVRISREDDVLSVQGVPRSEDEFVELEPLG